MNSNLLIITHSSATGLNQRQAMEIFNLSNSDSIKARVFLNPEDVTNDDIAESDKIIMVVPEWNGSFPWTFKKMIDGSLWPSVFSNKKILLVGTSLTTFGNLSGVTQLKHILEWCGADVYNQFVCAPFIDKKFANNDIQVDERLNSTLSRFLSI